MAIRGRLGATNQSIECVGHEYDTPEARMARSYRTSWSQWGGACALDFMGYIIFGNGCYAVQIVQSLLLCKARESVARHYGIEHNVCENCMISFFCAPCAIMQLGHQVWSDPDDGGFDFSMRKVMKEDGLGAQSNGGAPAG